MKKTLYNIKTGESATVEPVDAAEYLKYEDWTETKPVEEGSKPKKNK